MLFLCGKFNVNKMSKKREFKFYPEDFGDLTVKVKHMNLYFNVFDDHTIVESEMIFDALDEISKLELNCKNLEILEVSEDYKYDANRDILVITFAEKLRVGNEYRIKTKSICRPTSNVLEGLYFDETPDGCPPQQITQCQQWGFQRIVPCIDDMTAKCTYSTTIEADSRYTNILSNGNLINSELRIKSSELRIKNSEVRIQNAELDEKNGRVVVQYENTITPMATYLFFLGVGTYDTFKREFVYPEGTTFDLELLIPPGSDENAANKALDIMYDSILYVHLFTGPDKYENWDNALKIRELIYKRNDGEDVQSEIDKLYQGKTWGYKYTGTAYREIGMQNSDFGGMENVGNTTITTNRIMPFAAITDGAFEYMIAVKVHEFYHNLNGSEVTGRSPFEIWLNEAVTVFIEQEYGEFLFGKDYQRIGEVLGFLAPGRGTFAMDENAASMPIEPDGFNDPNELITGVTYVKAPEFVRMIETLMGKETFVKGLDLYHRRFKHSNASRAQWIEAMEEASGMEFKRMAESWLKQSNYPKVDVSIVESDGQVELTFTQKGYKEGMHWEFPIRFALCDESGEELVEVVHRINDESETLVFEDIETPAFYSLNRGFSFFGKINWPATKDELVLQVKNDSDVSARYMAFNRLAELEKMAILNGAKSPSEEFIDLYFELLSDEKLMKSVGPAILTIFEQVDDEAFAHDYEALYQAVKKIKLAIAKKYSKELNGLYKKLAKREFEGQYVEKKAKEIKNRSWKNVCLGLLAKLDNEEVHELLLNQYENADCASDEIAALGLYLSSSAKQREAVLSRHRDKAATDLVAWEAFLATVARGTSKETVDLVRTLENDANFRIDQANDQRALYAAFAGNRRLSIQREDGLQFLKATIIKLADVNEYSCGYVIKAFGDMSKMKKSEGDLARKYLSEARSELDYKKTPSVCNTIDRILAR